jgi:hypothetical protein
MVFLPVLANYRMRSTTNGACTATGFLSIEAQIAVINHLPEKVKQVTPTAYERAARLPRHSCEQIFLKVRSSVLMWCLIRL